MLALSLPPLETHTNAQEQADDGESYKLGRGSLRGGGNDAKGDLGGSVPWGADSKECQQQGENRGKMLSSLAKQASPRPSEVRRRGVIAFRNVKTAFGLSQSLAVYYVETLNAVQTCITPGGGPN